MPGPKPKRNDDELKAALAGANGNQALAAKRLGMSKARMTRRLQRITEFEIDHPPTADRTIDEILAARKAEYARKEASEKAAKLIPVRVKIPGPIGILHFGDPHLDDPGCDIGLLERHVQLVRDTEGLWGGAIGDATNNWVGRLAHLYSQQATTERESLQLIEWFIGSIRWLYMAAGNHDLWSGENSVLKWLLRQSNMLTEWEGIRLALKFPNGRQVIINARHDFKGHSQWNPAHGPAKAAQMGWRDNILICGHKHITGYAPLKDPNTGTISHAIRLGTYKTYDRYAKREGFPDGNFGPACLTIIDPDATDERDLIQVFWAIERGVDYLRWLRAARPRGAKGGPRR